MPNFFFLSGFRLGVRVVSSTSRIGESVGFSKTTNRAWVKANEIWAMYGYSQVQSPFRVRTLWEAEVPTRLKSKILQSRIPTSGAPVLRLKTARPILKLLSWNATRGLIYQEWLCWCNTRPEDVIIVQEIDWSMTGQWQTDQWLCVHSHAASTSLLVMVRRTLVRQSQLAYHDTLSGRLMHIRLMLT